MTSWTDVTGSSTTTKLARPTPTRRATTALVLSIFALGLGGVSAVGWAQASAERDSIESRLVCLELPGPNDCQQDEE
ncbi:hypothetical protein [Agrococcus sp. Ld7]|uniref:hypothetical protein n=1 Tax=Agrococcus sp. Ld7 TaxID=649148 RepID=UPI003870D454